MIQSINVTLKSYAVPEIVHGVQNDTDRYLEFNFVDFEPQVSNATLYVRKPSGALASTPYLGTTEKVTVSLDDALEEVGTNECTLEIETMDGTLSSFKFFVECHVNVRYGEQPAVGGTFSILFYQGGDEVEKKFAYESGMTWQEFYLSAYNPPESYTEDYLLFNLTPDDEVLYLGHSIRVDGEAVNTTDTIDPDLHYTADLNE